jgi:DNA polymerase-1
VKECFIAKPGYVLINADYSQLELRLASAYADKDKLKTVVNEGRDIFTEMSQQLQMSRQDTKTLTYSIQYGAGIPRIMSAFDVSKEEAARLRQNFYDTYPKFRALSEAVSKKAEKDLETRIWTGRYRHYAYKSESYKAMNAMIQGGAADIVERMMCKLFDEIDNEDCKMLMQVHDSVLFEVREDLVEHYKVKIKETMEDVDSIATKDVGGFGVRFAVDVGKWTEE